MKPQSAREAATARNRAPKPTWTNGETHNTATINIPLKSKKRKGRKRREEMDLPRGGGDGDGGRTGFEEKGGRGFGFGKSGFN